MTLLELEKWFALAIANYHSSLHSGIGKAPIACWNQFVDLGQELFRVSNSKAFLVDFLPIVRRRIQRQGFVIDHIPYMSPALKVWINEKDRGYEFVIRRDPRDLSRIYVLHPKESHYIEVPYRTFSNPAVTLWEHRFAVKKLKEEGRKFIDEEAIFKTIQKMRKIAQNAISKTKSARRFVTRLKHLESSVIGKNNNTSLLMPPIDSASNLASKPVKLFEEIEEWS